MNKYRIIIFGLLLYVSPLALGAIPNAYKKVGDRWLCPFCGRMNDDSTEKCKNWDCPTNSSTLEY